MYHVLDHEVVVYTGELSQSTQYVIEHYGKKFDDVIRSGILILYSDPAHCLHDVMNRMLHGNAIEKKKIH
jgi:hypothetical protein